MVVAPAFSHHHDSVAVSQLGSDIFDIHSEMEFVTSFSDTITNDKLIFTITVTFGGRGLFGPCPSQNVFERVKREMIAGNDQFNVLLASYDAD